MEGTNSSPLSHCHFHKLWAFVNRIHAFTHFLALSAIFYYRGAYFFNKNDPKYTMVPFIPWLLVFTAEILLSFVWLLKQPYYWRPVTRTVFPERLPKDENLPGIDVFICTTDPKKEPSFEVMNTVVSAMTLDYPAQKLSVYLSDDGGFSVTLKAMKEAWIFATWWLPYCRRYNIKSICPVAYFEDSKEESMNQEFIADRKLVKERYEAFKQHLQSNYNDTMTSPQDHPALIQVINRDCLDDTAATLNPEDVELPLLVYVARQKKPDHRHNFKGGALNVLFRVSSKFSNSPYVLVLDCDMYCNSSSSARQAMCFYLDPTISPSIGWVQYPQKFHNVTKTDIYDSQMRNLWPIYWLGADGIQGPVISGTNFYIKREALYDGNINIHGNNLRELKDCFGTSNEFINSLSHIYKANTRQVRDQSSILLEEVELLASCNYEKGTKWGEKVGFRYGSVMEDILTTHSLQTKGWRSVYLNPSRPQFLGSSTTNLNEAMNQGIRWKSGLLGIGLSKHCPLVYHSSKMPLLQKMLTSWLLLLPLDSIMVLISATVPSLCFLYGIPLYPKASDPFMLAFSFTFVSSQLRQLCDMLISGGSLKSWYYDQVTSMIKAVTCNLYGLVLCVMNKLGIREENFIPTNKAGGDDKTKYYEMDKYDFRTSNMFLVPFVTLVILNLACFIGGVSNLIFNNSNLEAMLVQFVLSLYVLGLSFPVIEGMIIRKDNGRIQFPVTLMSFVVCFVVLCLGYVTQLN